MPFGVTNGVSKFQRTIGGVIQKEQLCDTFPFMDNVTGGAKSKESLQEIESKLMLYNHIT